MLVLICIATAAIMWFDVLAIAVGRRDFVGTVHQTAGLLSPIPLAIGLLFPSFRSDVRNLEGGQTLTSNGYVRATDAPDEYRCTASTAGRS